MSRPRSNPRRVALVGCCKSKLDRPAPARELYTSDLFRKSLAYAEKVFHAHDVFILSAKYGAIRPDAVVAPYDESLSDYDADDLANWAHVVTEWQLRPMLGDEPAYWVLLAAERYMPEVPQGIRIRQPLVGLEIGQRLSWLKTKLAEAESRAA